MLFGNVGYTDPEYTEKYENYISEKDNKTLQQHNGLHYTFTHADPIAFMEVYSGLYDQGVTNPKDMFEKGMGFPISLRSSG